MDFSQYLHFWSEMIRSQVLLDILVNYFVHVKKFSFLAAYGATQLAIICSIVNFEHFNAGWVLARF